LRGRRGGKRDGRRPDVLDVGEVVGEDAVLLPAVQVEERREAPGPTVHVRGHEHVVVETEDRVVHGRVVVAKLGAVAVTERIEVVERRADPGTERTAEALLLVASSDVRGVRVGNGDPNRAAGGRLATEEVDEPRVVLGQVEERVAKQIDVGLRIAEKLPPHFRGDVDAVRVGVDDLRGRRLPAG
jgi:hypothetical protein